MAESIEFIQRKIELLEATITVQDTIQRGAGIKYREHEGFPEQQQPYWDMMYLSEVTMAGLIWERDGLRGQLKERNGQASA